MQLKNKQTLWMEFKIHAEILLHYPLSKYKSKPWLGNIVSWLMRTMTKLSNSGEVLKMKHLVVGGGII